MKRNFLKSVLKVFSAQSFFALSLLLVGIITARLLGPEGRGSYSLFFVLVGFGISFLNFGISQSNTYYFAKIKKVKLFANSLFACFIITIFSSLFAILFNYLGDGNLPLFLLVICFSATLMEAYLSGIFLGGRFFSQYSTMLVFQGLILLAVTCILIVFPNFLEKAIALRVCGVVLIAIIFFFYLWYLLEVPSLGYDLPLLKKQIKFGASNWIQNLIGQVNYRVYILALAFWIDDSAVGVYSVALLVAEFIRFIPDALCTMLFPELAHMDDRRARELLASQALRIILLLVSIVGLIMFFISPILIPFVFGKEYNQAISLFQIMIIGIVAGSAYQTLTRFFNLC